MRTRFTKIVTIFVFVVVLVLIMNDFVFDSGIQGALIQFTNKVSNSVQKYASQVALTVRNYKPDKELKLRIGNLENQIASASDLERELETLKEENELLRLQLGVEGKAGYEYFALADVTGVYRTPFSSRLFINKGSKHGIEPGFSILLAGNKFMGSVHEVYSNSSLVILLDDPSEIISVTILPSGTTAAARGAGSGKLDVDLVGVGESVNLGDELITSGLDGNPKFLKVGVVSNVQSRSGAIFQDINADVRHDVLSSKVFIVSK